MLAFFTKPRSYSLEFAICSKTHTTPAIWEIKFDSLGAFARGKGKKVLKRLASRCGSACLAKMEDRKRREPASNRKSI